MRTVVFQTKLCKPRHPFTNRKVERLIRYVKKNSLTGRSFWNVTHMNREAIDWDTRKNATFHKSVYGVPQNTHFSICAEKFGVLEETSDIQGKAAVPLQIDQLPFGTGLLLFLMLILVRYYNA